MNRVLVINHQDRAGLGRLGEASAFADLEVVDLHPARGDELPANLDGYAGLIVLGGAMAAWQDDVAPWLTHTRELLAEGLDRAVPTLGLCLGGQLLAMAAGGQVNRGAAGLEVGLVDVALTPHSQGDPLFAPIGVELGGHFSVVHWHTDAVVDLPPDAVLLVTSQTYPHQAFRVGPAAWGVQYHPEVTAEDWAEWMTEYREQDHPGGLPAAAVDGPVQAAQERLDLIGRAHAAAFADVVLGRADPLRHNVSG